MAPTFFAKLRARCEKRELEKARQEGSEARRKHNEVVACAEWAAAALAVAEKTGDPVLIQKCCQIAVAANFELNEMNRNAITEIAGVMDFVKSQSTEK